MKRTKPQLLDAPSDSDNNEIDIKKIVQDTSSSDEEAYDDGFEGGEDEMSEMVDFNAE